MQIKTLLLKLARESCLACLSSLQERISMLQERPAELDMFMAYQVQSSTSAWLADPAQSCSLQTFEASELLAHVLAVCKQEKCQYWRVCR